MARITLQLDQRNKTAERFPLVIRVSHKSKVKYLQKGHKLLKKERNEKRQQIKLPFHNHSRANANVQMKLSVAS